MEQVWHPKTVQAGAGAELTVQDLNVVKQIMDVVSQEEYPSLRNGNGGCDL